MSFAGRLRGASSPPPLHLVGAPAAELQAATGLFAAGLTVVTTRDLAGRPLGCTASAVSAVSLRPALVLACLREDSATLAALLERRRFVINVLSSDHHELAERFARPMAPDPWETVAHGDLNEVPVLEEAIAALCCDLHDIADGGDHSVVVGHVISQPKDPLP